MTATIAPRPVAARAALTQPGLAPAGWPLALVGTGMPLMFFLGLHAFVWVVPAFVFGAQLLEQRNLRVPVAAVPLGLLVVWIPLGALRLTPSELPLFSYRFLLFASTFATLLWIVNTSQSEFSNATLVRHMSRLWIALIGFGYLAMLFPRLSVASPFQIAAPGPIVSNPFFFDLTRLRFAELQTLVTIEAARPAAPMAYANGWGSTVGLLTPFFALDWLVAVDPRRRRVGWMLAVAAVVPIVVSVNRGLWLSLTVAVVYLAARRALRGDLRMIIGVGIALVIVLNAVLLSPLGATVRERFEDQDQSNSTRVALYEAAFDYAQKSPLVGWGTTIDIGLGKQLGTHGLVWYSMFVHGFPALIFLLAFATFAVLGTARAPTQTSMFAHLVVIIFVTQLPYYGLLPQVLVVAIAVGVSRREYDAVFARRRRSGAPEH